MRCVANSAMNVFMPLLFVAVQ